MPVKTNQPLGLEPARGAPLQAADAIHYIITDANAAYPPDRVRAVVGRGGAWSYDVSTYDELLRKMALAVLAPLGVTADGFEASTSGHMPSVSPQEALF